jgi:hypothetical protein
MFSGILYLRIVHCSLFIVRLHGTDLLITHPEGDLISFFDLVSFVFLFSIHLDLPGSQHLIYPTEGCIREVFFAKSVDTLSGIGWMGYGYFLHREIYLPCHPDGGRICSSEKPSRCFVPQHDRNLMKNFLLEDGEVEGSVGRHLWYTDRACPLESVCICRRIECHELRWNRNSEVNTIFEKRKYSSISCSNWTYHRQLESTSIIRALSTIESEVYTILIKCRNIRR